MQMYNLNLLDITNQFKKYIHLYINPMVMNKLYVETFVNFHKNDYYKNTLYLCDIITLYTYITEISLKLNAVFDLEYWK